MFRASGLSYGLLQSVEFERECLRFKEFREAEIKVNEIESERVFFLRNAAVSFSFWFPLWNIFKS